MIIINHLDRIDLMNDQNQFDIVFEVVITEELTQLFGNDVNPFLYVSYHIGEHLPYNLQLYCNDNERELHYSFSKEEEKEIALSNKEFSIEINNIISITNIVRNSYRNASGISVSFDNPVSDQNNIVQLFVEEYGNNKTDINLLLSALIFDELHFLKNTYGHRFKVDFSDYSCEKSYY